VGDTVVGGAGVVVGTGVVSGGVVFTDGDGVGEVEAGRDGAGAPAAVTAAAGPDGAATVPTAAAPATDGTAGAPVAGALPAAADGGAPTAAAPDGAPSAAGGFGLGAPTAGRGRKGSGRWRPGGAVRSRGRGCRNCRRSIWPGRPGDRGHGTGGGGAAGTPRAVTVGEDDTATDYAGAHHDASPADDGVPHSDSNPGHPADSTDF